MRRKTEEQIDKVFQPDELPPGVVQLAKVYIAEKRKISVGDKMAGRHGNKGIIARIAPEEDMPFLPDGTPVEIVLNPLGVPSRMNVGQVLETHLGWAARVLGFEAKTPVFHGGSEDEVGLLLKLAALRWAHQCLDIKAEMPPLDADSTTLLIDLARDLPQREVTHVRHGNGNGTDPRRVGIGRTVDAYLALKLTKAQARFFDSLKNYLVQAGKELAERQEAGFAEAFPAIAHLSRKRKLDGGLDAASLEIMDAANILPNGKIMLRDGRSGRQFDFPVTVGIIYMLKLSHLVDDKIHARSIGPYSSLHSNPLPVRHSSAGSVSGDGGVGTGGVRRRAHAAGDSHGEVGRRRGPLEGVRGHREGRQPPATRNTGVIQRPC